MRFLEEHRRRPACLADHLPWAILAAPGVVLNKDGAFTTALRFRGPDLESSTQEELMAVRARLNNALRRLGSGWCLHVEAHRRPADPYPESRFEAFGPWLIEEERRAAFETADPGFETDFRAALTWLAPAEESGRLRSWLFDGLERQGRDWRESLARFEREAGVVLDLMSDCLPEAERMDDEALLQWLHECVSPEARRLQPPPEPVFLDALLADRPLSGGLAPRLGGHALRVVSVRGLPQATRPGLLDALGALPFAHRWTVRWIALDKADAEREILRLRRRWFAKRKGIGVLLREAITKEESPLVDTDAAAKSADCDIALEALGAEACAFGYMTVVITVLHSDPAVADARARAVEAALNAQGLVARTEDLNAVEAWLGSLPGEPYADVRRPLVSTLNLADLLPISAAWAGPATNEGVAPLALARTAGTTPFRLSLHVGDVGHAMVVGPTGSGKSALLAFLAVQWFRYPNGRVVFLDKGRSARAATLAAGGTWRALEPGGDLALQPLARVEDQTERSWAAEWIGAAVAKAGLDLTPARREAIWSALGALAAGPQLQRTLTVFCALLQDPHAAAALEPLTLAGAYGALLDGAAQTWTPSDFDTFELETVMASPSVLPAVLGALFHELERSFDGRPTLLVLDEAWLFLDHADFAGKIREWLKTLRKRGVAVVFATQSLEDVAGSAIAASLIENCPTQVFLPNPRALEPAGAELYKAFGLNRRQLELIAFASPRRAYYWRQPRGRRLFDLRLSGAALAICGASSPQDQLLIDQVLSVTPPGGFVLEFLKAKGVVHVDQVHQVFLDARGR